MSHRHRTSSTSTVGFSACVSPHNCRPESHGGVMHIDTCACGATRRRNSTGGVRREEIGRWIAVAEMITGGQWVQTYSVRRLGCAAWARGLTRQAAEREADEANRTCCPGHVVVAD